MHVVVNAAMSADGKLSTRERTQVEISGPDDFDRVDAVRAASDAVMVGVGTVLADDPSLTLDDPDRRERREADGRPPNPARVVADSTLRTPPEARIVNDDARTYLLTTESAPSESFDAYDGSETEVIVAGDERVDLTAGLAALAERGVDQLMVEGGGELVFSLFEAGLVDELSTFVGSVVIGGRSAPTLADGNGFVSEFPALALRDVEQLDDGVVLHWDVE